MPLSTWRDVWPECTIVKDLFWAMANELSLDVAIPFESVDKEEEYMHQTLSRVHF